MKLHFLTLLTVSIILIENLVAGDGGEFIFRLPYHAGEGKVQGLGILEVESFLRTPIFLGTDWKGQIYFLDCGYTVEEGALKVFDKQGRLIWITSREEWRLLGIEPKGYPFTVTKEGYVWFMRKVYYNGVLIKDFNKYEPEGMDKWFNKLKGIIDFKKVWKSSPIIHLWSGGGKVVIDLLINTPSFSHERKVCRVVLTSDGNRILKVRVGRVWHEEMPYLGSDGKWWTVKVEGKALSGTFKEKWITADGAYLTKKYAIRLWIWSGSKGKRKPVIDLSVDSEPWKGRVSIVREDGVQRTKDGLPTNAYLNLDRLRIDSKGNIYLILTRWRVKESDFNVNVKVRSVWVGATVQELALVVLNEYGRVISSIDWTPVCLEYPSAWIHPLPDGRGFYRVEYTEKEARVYFHPLPK